MKTAPLYEFTLFGLTQGSRLAIPICTIAFYFLLSSNSLAQSDTIYAYDGTVESTRTFSNGKRTGTWHSYYSTGKKYQETTYSANSKRGKVVEYWPKGTIRYLYCIELVRQTGEYQKVGKLKLFYPNGMVYFECVYRNGMKNGRALSFFENGQLSEAGRMRNDDKVGSWRYFDERGMRLASPREEEEPGGFSE